MVRYQFYFFNIFLKTAQVLLSFVVKHFVGKRNLNCEIHGSTTQEHNRMSEKYKNRNIQKSSLHMWGKTKHIVMTSMKSST